MDLEACVCVFSSSDRVNLDLRFSLSRCHHLFWLTRAANLGSGEGFLVCDVDDVLTRLDGSCDEEKSLIYFKYLIVFCLFLSTTTLVEVCLSLWSSFLVEG